MSLEYISIIIICLRISLANQCHYIINRFDGKYDICESETCNQIIDPYLIEVKPLNCKTMKLYLKFSTFKNYDLFLKRLDWKLGNLFPLKTKENQQRLLRIYLLNIDIDDKLIDHYQLNRLGFNIDQYELFIENLNKINTYNPIVHYDFNQPQWNIIQIQFNCKSLIRLDENSCSFQIIRPSVFVHQRSLISSSSSSSSTSTQSLIVNHHQSKSEQSFLLIAIFSFFLLSILILIIFVYRKCSIRKLDETTSSISSISQSISVNEKQTKRRKPIAEAYQVSRIPSPHKESIYQEVQQHF